MDGHEDAIAAAIRPADTLLERLAERIGGRAQVEAVFEIKGKGLLRTHLLTGCLASEAV